MDDFITLAAQLADTAGNIARRYFRADFTVENKADETPVTVADRTIEESLRALIERERPEDGILGEEFGTKDSRNGYTWVIDPIDGTKSFIAGLPIFGTLIALCRDNVPILGVIDQPVLKERWIGAEGMPTTFNGQPVKTRPCPSLKAAIASSTSPSYIRELWPVLHEKCGTVIWGGDCYPYGLMACGWLDVIVEQGLAPHDFAALAPVVTGAGGWIGDWEGRPLTLESDGRILALGDPALKDEALALLSE